MPPKPYEICGYTCKWPMGVFSTCIAHDLDAKQLTSQLKAKCKAGWELPKSKTMLSKCFGHQTGEQSIATSLLNHGVCTGVDVDPSKIHPLQDFGHTMGVGWGGWERGWACTPNFAAVVCCASAALYSVNTQCVKLCYCFLAGLAASYVIFFMFTTKSCFLFSAEQTPNTPSWRSPGLGWYQWYWKVNSAEDSGGQAEA